MNFLVNEKFPAYLHCAYYGSGATQQIRNRVSVERWKHTGFLHSYPATHPMLCWTIHWATEKAHNHHDRLSCNDSPSNTRTPHIGVVCQHDKASHIFATMIMMIQFKYSISPLFFSIITHFPTRLYDTRLYVWYRLCECVLCMKCNVMGCIAAHLASTRTCNAVEWNRPTVWLHESVCLSWKSLNYEMTLSLYTDDLFTEKAYKKDEKTSQTHDWHFNIGLFVRHIAAEDTNKMCLLLNYMPFCLKCYHQQLYLERIKCIDFFVAHKQKPHDNG